MIRRFQGPSTGPYRMNVIISTICYGPEVQLLIFENQQKFEIQNFFMREFELLNLENTCKSFYRSL